MLKRKAKKDSDSTQVVSMDNTASLQSSQTNFWKRPSGLLIIAGIAVIGAITITLSLASTPSLTKVWATNADWNSGTLNDAVVGNNEVSLASTTNTSVASTQRPAKTAQTNADIAAFRPTLCSNVPIPSQPCSSIDDENINTFWTSESSDPQWARVDLGQTYNINEVRVKWGTNYATAYQIQVSNDGSTWQTVYSTTASKGGIQDITGLSASGRYIRMYGTQRANSNQGYSLRALKVYGQPASTGVTYVSNGSETLDFDATVSSQWNSITPTSNLPTGTSISYQYRTSTDNSTWSTWADISTIANAPKTRYIQIMAALSTTNNSVTPSLESLTLSYASQAAAPVVTLTASPATINSGQSAMLTWSSQNADTCTGSGGWSGTEGTAGSVSTGALTQTTNYTITCTGAGGSANSSAIVTVQSAGGGGYSCVTTSIVTNVQASSCPANGGIYSDSQLVGINHPSIQQDAWGANGTDYASTLSANSPHDWQVAVSLNSNPTGAIAAYPSLGWNIPATDDVNEIGPTIDSFPSTTSSWNVTIPTNTTTTAGWAAYDLWFNYIPPSWGYQDEVMIQTDITANSDYACGANHVLQNNITIDGQSWHLCDFAQQGYDPNPSNAYAHSERVLKPGPDDNNITNMPSGSVNIKDMLDWLMANDYLPQNSQWIAGGFGFEISHAIGSPQIFQVNNFSWNQQ